MLTRPDVLDRVDELAKDQKIEWARLRRFVRYARGQQSLPWLPDNVESEYKDIARKSASNWLDLVIRCLTQGLLVDGYGDTTVDADQRSAAWIDGWQANGYDARQHALHRAIFTTGYAFNFVLPTADEDGADGGVWMRPEAATNVAARYGDSDLWPDLALRVTARDRTSILRCELYDDEARYTVTGKGSQRKIDVFEHGLEVCPAVQLRSSLDLLGTPMGEIEPVISIQDRIVDATFTLQMVAKYGAFPQRWIAGLNAGEPLRDSDGVVRTDPDGNPIYPSIKAYVDSILLASDPDTKFGQFGAADLRQYVEALEAHIRHLAAITQTPPHYLLGSLVNLAAEALAAAESGLQRKIAEKREVIGEGHEQTLRLAARVLGDDEAANDTSSQVHWQDVESRSLAQTSDALLKLQQLGIPLPLLMRMIPGLSQTDIADAERMLSDNDPMAALVAKLDGATATDPTTIKAKADAMGVLIRAGATPKSAAAQVGLESLEFTGAVPTSLRLPENQADDLETV